MITRKLDEHLRVFCPDVHERTLGRKKKREYHAGFMNVANQVENQ